MLAHIGGVMFTYGYIREAVLAHLDIDEEEAEAMNLLSRLHIYANEAMQAICASKPMYQYIDITVVEKYDLVVTDAARSFFRPATADDLKNPDTIYLTKEEMLEYYHNQNIYEINEPIKMGDTFITFVNKFCWHIYKKKPTMEQIFEHIAFDTPVKEITVREEAKPNRDFMYTSKNQLVFYKEGRYLIPASFLWYRFDSGIGDKQEIDMPSDIFLTIPLYIASICLQIDNMQKAQILRNEFELALARCTSGDMLTLNKIPSTW